MPLIVIVAIVAYLGVAMAFYFGFSAADSVGEPVVNGCCALAWPLVLAICVLIGPFFSFWWLAASIHGEEDKEDGSGFIE